MQPDREAQMDLHALPPAQVLRGRQDFIVDRCRGKCTLHLGCVDEGLTVERLAAGGLLHTRLQGVASELWGMDVSDEGIALLEAHGVEHLVHGNIERAEDLARLPQEPWEIIVVSEVLEHLSNPGAFLDAAHELFTPQSRLILSVPNGLCITRSGAAFRGVERVHPDHNYWFSCTTLTTLLERHGYAIEERYGYAFSPTRFDLGALFKRLRGGRAAVNAPVTTYETHRQPTSRPSGRWAYFAGLLRALPAACLTLALARIRPWAVSEGIIVVARSGRRS